MKLLQEKEQDRPQRLEAGTLREKSKTFVEKGNKKVNMFPDEEEHANGKP